MVDPEQTAPESFYDEYGEREWERLDRDFVHRLEWEGTVEQLAAHLPAPAGETRVLDVGGGSGRYSIWLAEQGYEVTLVEPSDTQREIAREKIDNAGVSSAVTVRDGDVRDLDAPPETFNATLCLGGPLSHVLEESERARAAGELARVTVPDGPVFVSVIGLLGFVMMTVQYVGRGDDNGSLPVLPAVVQDGDLTGDRLTAADVEPFMADAHLFRRGELVGVLDAAGLTVESVRGLEGVIGVRRTHFDDISETQRETVRTLNDLLETDPTLADVSPHMLAVCAA